MTRQAKPLTATQLRAARLLARGATGIETARVLDIAPETVSRWRREPAFTAELRRAIELGKDGDPRTRVEALTPRALDALEAVLTNAKTDPALKVRAAEVLLSFAAVFQEPAPALKPDP